MAVVVEQVHTHQAVPAQGVEVTEEMEEILQIFLLLIKPVVEGETELQQELLE